MLKRTFLTAVFAALVGLFALQAPAYAQYSLGSNPANPFASEGGAMFRNTFDKSEEFRKNARIVIFSIAGIGLIALVVMAVFGKANLRWMISMVVGLFALFIADQIIGYFTSGPGTV